MGKVMVRLSMSLDGFIAGPNDGPENPLGGGVRLFDYLSVKPISAVSDAEPAHIG
jgi:hypothetical protein